MPSILPFEIWQKIYSYLTPPEKWKLYKVNRALFYIVLHERYETVIFRDHKSFRKLANLLSSPLRRQHVCVVKIWPKAFNNPLYYYRRGLRYWPLTRYITKWGTKAEPILHGLLNVTSLEVLLKQCHTLDPMFLPSIVAGWGAFRSSLRSLKLDIALEGWHLGLPHVETFPNLQELHIVISRLYLTTDEDTAYQQLIAPFVNRHQETLQVLGLMAKCVPCIRTSPLYSKINHLSALTTLRIAYNFISIKQSPTAPLRALIDRHADHLLKLTLHIKRANRDGYEYCDPPTDYEWHSQELLHMRLPKLEVLDLDIECFPTIGRTASWLAQFVSTLTTLHITGKYIPSNDVVVVADMFANTKNSLKNLGISVEILDPQVFDLLAKALPTLETFEPTAYYYSHLPAESFQDGFRQYDLTRWKLKHLRGFQINRYGQSVDAYEIAIREALPDLETLCLDDVTRFDVLSRL